MNLHIRTMLLITALLVVAVSATAAVLTWTSRMSLLAQTQADGELIARLLARSASFAEYVPHEVERAIGDQMVVEATIAAHLVAIAEEAGLSPAAINPHLQEIADSTVLDEFWITDETGHAVFRSDIATDFTFSPDVQQQPQAYEFWPLLTGERDVVVQEARVREVDSEVYKYVGVSGFDQPRIVQVGYQAAFLHSLAQQVGLTRLVAELVVEESVSAIEVVDSDLLTLAYSAVPGWDVGQAVTGSDASDLEMVIREGRTVSRLDGAVFKVMSPLADVEGRTLGATIVYLPTTQMQQTLRRSVQLSVLVAMFVLVLGMVASLILCRRVTRPVAQVAAAAAAVEAGSFDPDILLPVTVRGDELGRLARVFQRMIREVRAREQKLRQQVQALRIEIDDSKKARQVAEITESEYFKSLRDQAAKLRKRTEGEEGGA
jgi:HAMP domain-containing protein